MTTEQREKARARSAAWRARNKEKIAAKGRAWRAANPDKTREYSRRWNKANPEYQRLVRAHQHRGFPPPTRDARLYAAVVRFDPCSYCGGPAGTIDHVDTPERGGTNDWDNLTAACHSCNTRKRHRSLLDALVYIADTSPRIKAHVSLDISNPNPDD